MVEFIVGAIAGFFTAVFIVGIIEAYKVNRSVRELRNRISKYPNVADEIERLHRMFGVINQIHDNKK